MRRISRLAKARLSATGGKTWCFVIGGFGIGRTRSVCCRRFWGGQVAVSLASDDAGALNDLPGALVFVEDESGEPLLGHADRLSILARELADEVRRRDRG